MNVYVFNLEAFIVVKKNTQPLNSTLFYILTKLWCLLYIRETGLDQKVNAGNSRFYTFTFSVFTWFYRIFCFEFVKSLLRDKYVCTWKEKGNLENKLILSAEQIRRLGEPKLCVLQPTPIRLKTGCFDFSDLCCVFFYKWYRSRTW